MTTRVQQETRLHNEIASRGLRMHTLEKVMLCNATFAPGAKVLDANVCSGQVAEYLLQHTDCQVCGVSDRMEEVRQTRARMNGGDFAYAAIGDIPWQDNTFDTILLHPSEGGLDALREQLRECRRVMKPGGQLVLGLRSLPSFLDKVGRFLWDGTSQEEKLPCVEAAQQAMSSYGFVQIQRVSAGLSGHVLTGVLSKEA